MPFYEVRHAVPLTVAQQDELAEALTTIHSTHFTTPRLLVNVQFIDSRDSTSYVGGKRRSPPTNTIRAHVRGGPARKRSDYEKVCRAIVGAWDSIVPMPKTRRSDPDADFRLRNVWVLGAIAASFEMGFMLPEAGGDREWLRENLGEFEAKAEAGDEEFGELVRDVRERGLLD